MKNATVVAPIFAVADFPYFGNLKFEIDGKYANIILKSGKSRKVCEVFSNSIKNVKETIGGKPSEERSAEQSAEQSVEQSGGKDHIPSAPARA